MNDKLVIMGMSCVGKTEYASTLKEHEYLCFDALFPWNDIETLGLSTEEGLRHVRESCASPKFVLDGWHLSDPEGLLMPRDATVCVVYAPYDQIISQYRVPVEDHDQHRTMFRKWYHEIKYPSFQSCCYIFNTGIEFEEKDNSHFQSFLETK